jgi:hypothetical protein
MTDAPEKPKPITSKPHHPQVIHILFPIVTFFDFSDVFAILPLTTGPASKKLFLSKTGPGRVVEKTK